MKSPTRTFFSWLVVGMLCCATATPAWGDPAEGPIENVSSGTAIAETDKAGEGAFEVAPFPATLTSVGISAAEQSHYNYPLFDTFALSDTENLPASFDLRTHGWMSSIKHQGPWGTCWAFATLASLESNLLMQAQQADEPDLSERQLAWFAGTPITAATDPIQAGEGSWAEARNGAEKTPSELRFNMGADRGHATTQLASWQGITTEKRIPYQNNEGVFLPDDSDFLDNPGDWSLPEEDRMLSDVHVQNVSFLPSPATFANPENPSTANYAYDARATAAIKQALMKNGAVSIAYFADQSVPNTAGNATYFNYVTWAQYVNAYITQDDPATPEDDRTTANHLVAIVGWDDSYPKENFSSDPSKQPPADGAWIVKNSWGTDWGFKDANSNRTGCFYLSYYDMTISSATSYTGEVAAADGSFSYDHNYQYDYLGSASVGKVVPGAFGTVSAANVFTAAGDETLEAVSATTYNPGTDVHIDVYLLDAGATGPTDGRLASSQTTTLDVGGYHTIALETPVELAAGQRFSVVEKIEGYEGCYLPLEVAAVDHNDPDIAAIGYTHAKMQAAKAGEGQSFYREDSGEWLDVKTLSPETVAAALAPSEFGGTPELVGADAIGNVMIKAFTTDRATEPPVVPDVDPVPEPVPVPESDPKPTGDDPAGSKPETFPLAQTGDAAPPAAALALCALAACAVVGAGYASRRLMRN